MRVAVVFISLLAQAVPADADKAVCRPDADGFCTAEVVQHPMHYTDGSQHIRVNVAIGEVMSLELPQDVRVTSDPVVGNQAVFEAKPHGPERILVWARTPRGFKGRDVLGVRSNLQIFLDSGVTLLVDLRVAPKAQAVQRVRFVFPQRETESDFVKDQLAEQARALRAQFEAEQNKLEQTAHARALVWIAESLLARHQCTDVDRRGENGLLIVWVERLCRIGDLTLVRFQVRNRYRDVFHLEAVDITVETDAENPDGTAELHIAWTHEPQLAFDETATGLAVWEVKTGAAAYRLTVTESGGKKRTVVVNDVRF